MLILNEVEAFTCLLSPSCNKWTLKPCSLPYLFICVWHDLHAGWFGCACLLLLTESSHQTVQADTLIVTSVGCKSLTSADQHVNEKVVILLAGRVVLTPWLFNTIACCDREPDNNAVITQSELGPGQTFTTIHTMRERDFLWASLCVSLTQHVHCIYLIYLTIYRHYSVCACRCMSMYFCIYAFASSTNKNLK